MLPTTIRQSKTHAFHGFSGVRNAPEMLADHINIVYKKSTNGFEITVHNKAPHNLLTHPLRVVQLKTTLKREGKSEILKTETFVTVNPKALEQLGLKDEKELGSFTVLKSKYVKVQ